MHDDADYEDDHAYEAMDFAQAQALSDDEWNARELAIEARIKAECVAIEARSAKAKATRARNAVAVGPEAAAIAAKRAKSQGYRDNARAKREVAKRACLLEHERAWNARMREFKARMAGLAAAQK